MKLIDVIVGSSLGGLGLIIILVATTPEQGLRTLDYAISVLIGLAALIGGLMLIFRNPKQ